jgi:hypothetical protein
MVLAQFALHRFAQLTVRLVADVTCSMQLLGLVPMHSDSQQFVRVADWFETFTAVTRVRTLPFEAAPLARHRNPSPLDHHLRASVLVQGGLVCQGTTLRAGKGESRLIHTISPWPAVIAFVASLSQMPPIVPVFADSADS